MADIDFSRAEEGNVTIDLDMYYGGVIDFTRSDEVAVDFTGKTIKMDIYKDSDDVAPLVTLTSGAEITIAVNRLSFDNTFTNLDVRAYFIDFITIQIRSGLGGVFW